MKERIFMKKTILALLAALALCSCQQTKQCSENCGSENLKHRKIALQCYSFKKFTFEDMLKEIKGLDLDALEGTPAQKVSAKYPEFIGPDMSLEAKNELKRLLKESGLKFVSYGVVKAKSDEDVVKYYEFAREFEMNAILAEDPEDIIKIWDKYSKRYGIKMYLHNHASVDNNPYYNPEVVMKIVSKYDGVMANPDNGHWSRSGINSAEGFRKLRGEIGSIHLKDQPKFGSPDKDSVPFGEGDIDVKSMLKELDSQGYNGYFVIEYPRLDNPLPEVKKCVEFLRNN